MLWVPFLISAMIVTGNWSDSTPKDETIEFFKDLEPSLLNIVKEKISKAQNNEISILNSLKGVVQQPLFGLLNLSLGYRIYHPKASINNPINQKPKLRGWSLINDDGTQANISFNGIQGKILSSLKNYTNPNEKLHLIQNVSISLYNVAKELSTVEPLAKPNSLNQFENNYGYFGINGRKTNTNSLDLITSLIDEYKVTRLLDSSSYDFLNSPYYRPPLHYTSAPPSPQYLVGHRFEDLYNGWPKQPNLKSDSIGFCKISQKVVKMTIFFNISSPETPALLRWAHESVTDKVPIHFTLIMNVDLNNSTEKTIAYAYHQLCNSLNVRNACAFLLDAYKKGSFKRAYKATLPSVSWRKLGTLMKPENSLTKRINEQVEYCRNHHINDTSVSINGDFIQERPIFNVVEKKAYSVVKKLKEAKNLNLDKIEEWFGNNSIITNLSTYPRVALGTEN
ncbi:hypothetical protein GPJ56_007819 [Histomonas meleagridis]|uniref:uncharacterized protein n=1 Tax=Histomonas meleagridis TaxID=135588 RepID=UPI003559B1BF|nr:hypothetical protein GPJ56_007819 [Histomonas meleagridis]KAH0798701.1 hypothetical protein GO595_008566 [Histomonas meleagridis]